MQPEDAFSTQNIISNIIPARKFKLLLVFNRF